MTSCSRSRTIDASAVKAWLASPAVKPPCSACGWPVRVGDGKVTLKGGVHHRACAAAAG